MSRWAKRSRSANAPAFQKRVAEHGQCLRAGLCRRRPQRAPGGRDQGAQMAVQFNGGFGTLDCKQRTGRERRFTFKHPLGRARTAAKVPNFAEGVGG